MSTSTLIGKELRGDNVIYRIESVLGQGSFGITYKAKAFTVMKGKFGQELVEVNRPKAIKEFFMKEVNERDASGSLTGMSEGSLSYNYAQKFKREAENLAGMDHPNIVKVIDFFSANKTYYYVMDYIDGENLNDYLKHHKMTSKEATDTILEIAKALRYMHEQKHMLHLDLKPGNIMRRMSDGHIFLIDFGLSKHYNEKGVPETSTNVGLGTPGYAPIEQANSKNARQFRATLDVYALGATFFKLLTGKTPPSADELVSDADIVGDELRAAGIDDSLISVVVRAMRPNVKQRIQNMKEFIESLEGSLSHDEDNDELEVTIISTNNADGPPPIPVHVLSQKEVPPPVNNNPKISWWQRLNMVPVGQYKLKSSTWGIILLVMLIPVVLFSLSCCLALIVKFYSYDYSYYGGNEKDDIILFLLLTAVSVVLSVLSFEIGKNKVFVNKTRKKRGLLDNDYIERYDSRSVRFVLISRGTAESHKFGLFDVQKLKIRLQPVYDELRWAEKGKTLHATKGGRSAIIDVNGRNM